MSKEFNNNRSKANAALSRRHFSAMLASACVAGSLLPAAAMANAAEKSANPSIKAAKSATVVVVGDSLSAEYGVKRGAGWVSLMAERFKDQKLDAQVHNAGISADTTAGGLSRLPSLLKRLQPDVVVLELGANDALRGLPLTTTESNLTRMIELSRKAGAKVLLVGMEVPPNYGPAYTSQFRAVFPKVAKAQGVPLVPFLLKNVADAPNAMELFQSDRMHPNETAQPILLDNVWPELKKLLKG